MVSKSCVTKIPALFCRPLDLASRSTRVLLNLTPLSLAHVSNCSSGKQNRLMFLSRGLLLTDGVTLLTLQRFCPGKPRVKSGGNGQVRYSLNGNLSWKGPPRSKALTY